MERINDLIDEGDIKVNERCWIHAADILESSEFLEAISEAMSNNKSEASLYINGIFDHYPSDSQWELIIEIMSDELKDEGVRITSYGWKHDENNDVDDYWIYLEW